MVHRLVSLQHFHHFCSDDFFNMLDEIVRKMSWWWHSGAKNTDRLLSLNLTLNFCFYLVIFYCIIYQNREEIKQLSGVSDHLWLKWELYSCISDSQRAYLISLLSVHICLCSWDKSNNPEPWNKLDPTYQYKVIQHTKYSLLGNWDDVQTVIWFIHLCLHIQKLFLRTTASSF